MSTLPPLEKFVWTPMVAAMVARPLHVSKVSQSKKGKTKQATVITDFHAHESESTLWPIRLVRS